MTEAGRELPVSQDKPAGSVERDWAPFESLRREVDRLFEDFRPFGWRLPQRAGFDRDLPLSGRGWSVNPAFDVVEKDNEYEITAELPGIGEENVDIKLNNRVLTIKGDKSESKEEKDKHYYLSERRYGSFQRSFQVPESVDAEKIEASFAKGILTLRLPKTAQAKHAEKKISIKAE